MVRLDRLREWLLQLDECQVLELLDITAEDLVARFEDLIIERRRLIEQEMEVLDSSTPDEELDFEDE